jgi:hypothetical protein
MATAIHNHPTVNAFRVPGRYRSARGTDGASSGGGQVEGAVVDNAPPCGMWYGLLNSIATQAIIVENVVDAFKWPPFCPVSATTRGGAEVSGPDGGDPRLSQPDSKSGSA